MLYVWVDVSVERVPAIDIGANPGYKVKIVGFDGLDPEFFDYLVTKGSLPNFKRLMDEGSSSICQTFKPTKSVVVWTSVATGKTMDKHGIVDWMLLSGDGKEKVLASGNARRTEALWNIATRGGRSVRILNWWATWPVEAVQGEMVSNHFPRSLDQEMDEVTFPDSLASELRDLGLPRRKQAVAALRRAGIPVFSRELAESGFLPSDNFRQRFQTSAGVFNEDMVTELASHHLYRTRGAADLEAILFRTTDVYAHFMWRFIDRRVAEPVYRELRKLGGAPTVDVSREMDEAYARVLEPVYVHADQRLGRMLEDTDSDTVLVVVSDHGFQFRNYGFNHYDHGEGGVKAPPGMIFLWGGPIRPGATLKSPSVFDVTPTALYLMGFPVGEDMDGRVLQEAIGADFLSERPLTWVKSYDLDRKATAPRRSPVDDEVLKELKSLGYLP